MSRMNRNFEGLLEVTDLPAAMFVIDTKSEAIAVSEAKRLGIPVV
ncbi:MAG: 30S ribosomal protein S2, partial [Verrucomicrobiota bacterium]